MLSLKRRICLVLFCLQGCTTISSKPLDPNNLPRLVLLPIKQHNWGKVKRKKRGQFKKRHGEIQYINDLLYQYIADFTRTRFLLMTRENMEVLLPPSRTLEDCIGSCEVETGRLLQADYLIQPTITLIPALNHITRANITLKLFKMKTGALVKSTLFKIKQIDAQSDQIENQVRTHVSQLLKELGISPPKSKNLDQTHSPSSSHSTQNSLNTITPTPKSKWHLGHKFYSSRSSSHPLYFSLSGFTGVHSLSHHGSMTLYGTQFALRTYFPIFNSSWKLIFGLGQEVTLYQQTLNQKKSPWRLFFDVPLLLIPSQLQLGLNYKKHEVLFSYSPLGSNSLVWEDTTQIDLAPYNPLRFQYGFYPTLKYGFWFQFRYFTHLSPSVFKAYPSPYFKTEGHISGQFGVMIGLDLRFMYLHAQKGKKKKVSSRSRTPRFKKWHREKRP